MHVYKQLKKIIANDIFFTAILALFVLQAGYIAIRSGFPLAFDEHYHLGIIALHSHHLTPFFSHLSDATGQYGALATDPSYLYHYLLSFPYRVITAITDNLFTVVLALRFISVGLFAVGIVLFRKVLAYTGASRALIHLILLAFIALPLESYTAAQINYDNLLFPVTGAVLLLCLRFVEKIKKNNVFDVRLAAGLLGLCFVGMQVKYTFLPIFAAIMVFAGYFSILWWRKNRKGRLKQLTSVITKTSNSTILLLVGFVVLSGGLFAWRFGYNEVKYGALVPACEQVLNVKSCMSYGVYARNYTLEQNHTPDPSISQAAAFVQAWTHITVGQLLTILNGNKGGASEAPFRMLALGSTVILAIGLGLVGYQWRKIRQVGYPIALFLVVTGVYLAALILKNYSDFTKYGIPIAIQGRYLLPVVILLLALVGMAYSITLKNTPRLKVATLMCVVFFAVQGGGVITYMYRTDQTWQWTNHANIQSQNLLARVD